MANQQGHFLTAIDVGSAKTCTLVVEAADSGLRYRGHGVAEYARLAQRRDRGTGQSCGRDSKGRGSGRGYGRRGGRSTPSWAWAGRTCVASTVMRGISLGTRPREIGRDEIKQAVERARAIPLPADREILHLLPQEFILDDQAGVHDPLGMMAARLEVRVHMVTAATSTTQNVITAVNKAGVHVDDTVYEPLAGADSVLRADEREMGVCLADIGAGSTELIVFLQGAVAYTGVIPVGGDHFTSDLSVGMCTPLAEAEKIKKAYGNAIVTLIPEGNEVEVPSVGDRPSRLLPQRLVAEILEPRARELFEMMRESLRHSGMFEACIAGVVLSGGASRLPGIFDVAESVLRKPVRLSWPTPLAKMPSTLVEPEYATVLGMVYYGQRARVARGLQGDRWGARLKALLVGA